jgi:hypothetical protein
VLTIMRRMRGICTHTARPPVACSALRLSSAPRAARLVKAGLLDKRHARRFALVSAWAELLGYCGNVTLNAMRIAAALEREQALAQELLRRKKARPRAGAPA